MATIVDIRVNKNESIRLKIGSSGKGRRGFRIYRLTRPIPYKKPVLERSAISINDAAVVYFYALIGRNDICEHLLKLRLELGHKASEKIQAYIPKTAEREYFATVNLLEASNVKPVVLYIGKVG